MKWPFLEPPLCLRLPQFWRAVSATPPENQPSPDQKAWFSIEGPSETLYHIAAAQVSRGRDLPSCGYETRGRGSHAIHLFDHPVIWEGVHETSDTRVIRFGGRCIRRRGS